MNLLRKISFSLICTLLLCGNLFGTTVSVQISGDTYIVRGNYINISKFVLLYADTRYLGWRNNTYLKERIKTYIDDINRIRATQTNITVHSIRGEQAMDQILYSFKSKQTGELEYEIETD